MQACSIPLTAKKSHYALDGTGRDSYITFNNGGNLRGQFLEGKGKFEVGTMRDPYPTRRRAYTGIQGRPLHYQPTGTGRDVYIMYILF